MFPFANLHREQTIKLNCSSPYFTGMSKRKEQSFVTTDDCARFRHEIRDELKVLKSALVGEDLRGGLVKDMSDIKATLSTARTFKDFLVPVAIAVISAILTAFILGAVR